MYGTLYNRAASNYALDTHQTCPPSEKPFISALDVLTLNIKPSLMDGIAEIASDPHHTVLVQLPTIYLLVHLCGQHAGLEVGAIGHLKTISIDALLLRLYLLHVLQSSEITRQRTPNNSL